MTDVFARRRFRLRAMKRLMDNYLPADQLVACPKCLRDIPIAQKEENLSVCLHCGYHWPIGAKRRLELIMDAGKYREINADVRAGDPLHFPGYPEKLQKAREATGMIDGHRCVVCALDGRFMMGKHGRGGALALGVADRVLMLENAVYAILSPEGFASILYKDASRAGEAAEVMKLTAPELWALGVIDGIIPEPQGGAHTDPASVMQAVDEAIAARLREPMKLQGKALAEQRYQKFRRMSAFERAETTTQPTARQEKQP